MSSTPGTGAKRHRDRHGWRADMQPLRKYTPTPSSGTAPLHQHHSYGFADFSPATQAMHENTLNERTIRYGFVDSPIVANEYASMHDVVHDRLRDARVFQELQVFAASVAQRQWTRGAIGECSVPKLPNRTVKSDERRDEWLRALANARVPLSTLVGSVPFGLRGRALLEALQQNHVPVSRALWAVRLTGVHEMTASLTRMPDRQGLKQLEPQHTALWSRQYTQYLEHVLASAPTTAVATPTSAWTCEWEYCLALLRAQYTDGLLDQRMLVSWLVTQLRQVSVDKCMVLLPLVREYTPEIARSRNPLRKLIAAVVFRIEQAVRYTALQGFYQQLAEYLIELFVAQPDAFVEPTTWRAYRAALEAAGSAMQGERRDELQKVVRQVDARNRKFECLANSGSNGADQESSDGTDKERNGCADQKVSGDGADRGTTVRDERGDVQTQVFRELEALGLDSDIDGAVKRVFGEGTHIDGHCVRLVCYWAVEDRLSASAALFRQLVCARLCRLHLDNVSQANLNHDNQAYLNHDSQTHSTHNSQAHSTFDNRLQSAVVGFLDVFPLPSDDRRNATVQRVCTLLERLSDVGCFSISKYLQQLTARGDFFGANTSRPRSQRHLAYVRSVPANTCDDYAQRQLLLYDCSDTVPAVEADTATCVQLKCAISAVLPFLVAYTCAGPLRAQGRSSCAQPGIGTHIAQWWLAQPADLLDACGLPTPAQLTAHRLNALQAQHVCTKDWIAPLADHANDARALGCDAGHAIRALLVQARRSDVDFVVKHRLLPIVYDYVVKDVTVGADNWRVITQPGTSLLNRRQTAAIIDVLTEAGYFGALLDLLLWLLAHTRVPGIVALVHATLRRFTRAWSLMGRLQSTVTLVEQAYVATLGGDSFEIEYLRTAHRWSIAGCELAQSLVQRVGTDYSAFAESQAPMLGVQGGSVPGSHALSAGKELLQLAQQLERDRAREAIASAADETDWAIVPCFQKLARHASSVTQRSDVGNSPGVYSGAKIRSQAVLVHVAGEAMRAAVHTGRTLNMRAGEESLLRTLAELSVQFVRWFALHAGLLEMPDAVGSAVLAALGTALQEWPMQEWPLNAGASEAELIGHVLATDLLATGCLRVHELVPWLINQCRDQVNAQTAAQFACVAGIIRALGEPSSATSVADMSLGDERLVFETQEMGAHWACAFDTHAVSRIQAVELVFTSAAASGRLRDAGLAQTAAALMHAASALAQSQWVQMIVDSVPNTGGAGYYTVLEIYRANIEPQIRDPHMSLPVKRSVLCALLTLCEGADPTAGGFSAMTTAEVAHRLHYSLRQFWAGTLFSNVHKLSTVLNSLLLFAGSALRESEASTDAFAVAAGGARMAGSAAASAGHSRSTSIQDAGGSVDHVQFVTDATTYVAACVQRAVMAWDCADGTHERRCKRLGEALATLALDVVAQIVNACAHMLFALNTDRIDTVDGADAEDVDTDDAGGSMPVHPRVRALVGATCMDVRELALSFVENYGTGAAGVDDDDVAMTSNDIRVICQRGSALAQLMQRLVATMGRISDSERTGGFDAGSPLCAARDFAAGILGQLQAIAVHTNSSVARTLQLCISEQCETPNARSDVSAGRVQMAVAWRLQVVRPLCHLLRAYPDEFAAGEWLTTLVTLCLAPACQPDNAQTENGMFQELADFAAIVSESMSAPMRKQALVRLRLVAPRLRALVHSPAHGDILSRLFPFEVTTGRTRGMAPSECVDVDNPWLWLEALEFAPLIAANVNAGALGGGLEGITPFTLRGVLEQDARLGNSIGYLANLRKAEPRVSRSQEVAEARGLQYLENPYFPIQPAILFRLADTPVPWHAFSAKRRRMDAETRLVWRSQCEAAFGPTS
ncbi:hypothetical protein IW147_003567 [Coemansia sp. RSA 720]|nr:hypothetical protein IW147_003567 [Coemansia sp. RSA 720]